MGYRCPLDNFYTTSNSAMCTHMMTVASTEHQEWIDSHGLSYAKLVLTGDYSPLKVVVEKECKIKD